MYVGLIIVLSISIIIAGAKIASELTNVASAIRSFRDEYKKYHDKSSNHYNPEPGEY